MSSALAGLLARQNQRIADLETQVRQLLGGNGQPGYKQPYIAVVSMAIAASRTPVPASITVSPTGPFVMTGYAVFWRENTQLKWRPISTLTEDDDASPEVDAIDFNYEITIGGTGWTFQNRPIPSPWLFSNYDRPRYLPTEFIVKGGESISVLVTPTATPNAAGILYFCFLGYKLRGAGAFGDSAGSATVPLEALPGVRVPYTIAVPMATTNSTTQLTGQYTHGSDLFAVTSVGAAYSDANGLYRPISSLPDNKVASPAVNSIDFLWRVNSSGDDLTWSSDRVPSPLLFTNKERPLYLPAPAQIPKGSVISVTVDPIVAPSDSSGVLNFIFDGYLLVQGR